MVALADRTLEGASVSVGIQLQAAEAPVVAFDNCNFVRPWHRVDAAVFRSVVAVAEGTGDRVCRGAV